MREEIFKLIEQIEHQRGDNLFLSGTPLGESQSLASDHVGAFYFEDLTDQDQIAEIDKYLEEG